MRWLRKVILGLVVLTIIGLALRPAPAHSIAAINGCGDAYQIESWFHGGPAPVWWTIPNLAAAAPRVNDADLRAAFGAFSADYKVDNPARGLDAVFEIQASCAAAGLL